jgi:hypothetical protein
MQEIMSDDATGEDGGEGVEPLMQGLVMMES